MKKNDKISDKARRILERVRSEGYAPKDVESWRLFHNKYNLKDYTYFTQVKNKEESLTYPAKFRWIPIQRKNLNVLISQQSVRPFVYSIKINDDDGKKRKFYSMLMGAVDFMFEAYKNYEYNIVASREQLQMQKDQFMQQLSQEPKNEAEAIELQRLKMEVPKINAEISKIDDILKTKTIISSKEIEKLNRYYTYDYKDFIEETAEILSYKIISANKFEEESTEAFTSKIVTGKSFYYVNHDSGKKTVTVSALSDLAVIYPRLTNVKWVHEGPWVGIKENWAYEDILRIYGHELTEEEKKMLENRTGLSTAVNPVFASTEGDGALLIQDDISYSGTDEYDAIEVIRLWYKEEKRIFAKVTPNKYYPSKPFIHFIDSEEELKRNPIRKDKNEVLETRYIEERYYGVQIGGIVNIGFVKDEIQPRDTNNLSRVYLPVVGSTNSSESNQSYSLIQATKDLAELYNVINYHRELYIAVSGVKGQIVDVSQKPTDMSLEMQRYFRKLGSLYIQTKTKSGKNLGSNYNQWKGYDDSLPSSINQLENILNNIDETLGLIMGVPRQRIGQVISTDQVGSNEQAVQQSSLVTEILHIEHDQLNARALELAVNIQLNYLTKPGDIIDFEIINEGGNKIYQIPEMDSVNSQIKIYLENNSRTLKIKNKLEQVAMNEYSKAGLPFRALIDIFNTDSLKQMEKKLEQFSKQAEDIAQNNAMAEMDKEERIKQAAKEIEIYLKQEDIKAKMAELQFNREKLTIESGLKQKELELNAKKEFTKIGSERETEAAYLKEQNRASLIDEQLEALRIQMDFLVNLKNIEAQGSAARIKNVGANKGSTNKQTKEKIKDR
ncbi:MAG: hypothetical protein JXR64_02995 [Spirochaetales bacterium]|nr:hypothetical protein [Spirochaetales bacterium]